MTPLEALIVAFGGDAVLLVVLGYLARTILSQLLAKDLKQFESRLAQACATAAEDLKHRLSLAAHEHHVGFSRMHDRQAQVLEEIYGKLLNFEDAARVLALAPEKKRAALLRRAHDTLGELGTQIRRNELYLPSVTSSRLHQLVERVAWLAGGQVNLDGLRVVHRRRAAEVDARATGQRLDRARRPAPRLRGAPHRARRRCRTPACWRR